MMMAPFHRRGGAPVPGPAAVAVLFLLACAACGAATAAPSPAAATADSAASVPAAGDGQQPPGPVPVLVDRIVAIVDEEPILQSEVEREISLYLLDARSRGEKVTETREQIRKRVLDRLVESKLMIAAARQEEIEVSDQQIEQEVQRNIDQLIRYYGSRQKLEQELARNGLTLEDYRLRSRSQLRDQQYMRAVIGRFIRPKIVVTEDEIEAYYREHQDQVPATPDSVTLADILIPVEPDSAFQQQLQRRLGEALAALGKGEPFADVARRLSQGPAAPKGGLIGTVRRGDLFSEQLEQVVFSLREGETSQPVVSERGVHILHVDAVTPEGRVVRQIFFPVQVGQADIDRARQRAEQARRRLLAGEPFARVAGEMSADPASADRGGNLGTFSLDDLAPAIRDAVAPLAPGELTEPIATPAGFYVMLVKDRVYGRRLSLEEVHDQIRQAIESRKIEQELDEYVRQLRQRFAVDIKD